MASVTGSELASFHNFISDQLQHGRADASPEEVLDLWRMQHPLPDLADDEIAAVQEALDDMRDGDQGLPLNQFDHEFRSRHGLKAE